MKRPIFIVGANRSGTTLLRLILNAHSRIGIPDELIYFDATIHNVDVRNWRRTGFSAQEYRTFVSDFLASNRALGTDLDLDALRDDLVSRGPRDLREPYCRLLEAWVSRQGKTRWGEKTPGNLFFVDVILDMFPDAHIVHLVRDPRAGVSSMNKASMFTEDVVFNSLNRNKYLVEGSRFLRQTVPAGQLITLRYEDLVSEPENQTRRLCEFLGEEFEQGMLRFYEQAHRYMEPRAVQDYNSLATRPVTRGRVDGWRHELAGESVALVEHVCAVPMREYGYAADGARLNLSTWAELKLKRAYWTWQVWRHRDIPQYTVNHVIFARTRERLSSAAESLRRRSPRWSL